jgi:hypothetical protein
LHPKTHLNDLFHVLMKYRSSSNGAYDTLHQRMMLHTETSVRVLLDELNKTGADYVGVTKGGGRWLLECL